MKIFIRTSLFACAIAASITPCSLLAQAEPPAPAAVVKASDWHAVMESSKANNKLDTKVNETPVKGGTVRVGIVHRTRPETRALLHQEFTETYYVVEGSGTLVTGGTL